jgi:hypothetical protein
MLEEATSKSVPVYALQSPDKSVKLKLQNPESGETQTEDAALLSFVYNLTEHRRPQPSVEPEKSIYKNLRPWKRMPIPNYVVVADPNASLIGAPVVAWDGKKSLQGIIPWERPVVGTVTGQDADYWTVIVDPVAMAAAKEDQAIRQAKALEKVKAQEPAPEPPPILPPAIHMQPKPPAKIDPPAEPEPISVEGTAAEPTAIDFDYTGDPFTISADGHYIGDDGFVVPANFDEFYEKYPKYVLNWVKKRLNRFVVDEDVEDWTQDLLIHMRWLPQASKHRMPWANGRKDGCGDVIETFDPYQQYGASERRFRNYINFCLANKFNTVQSKRQKNPVCRPGNVAFGIALDEADPTINSDEFIHANSQHLETQAERVKKQHDDRLFTNQFKTYVRKEDPSVFPAIEALEACGPMGEAAEYMGVTEAEFSRYRARLKQLGECFLKNQQAPKQRKPYKKRATTAG